MKKIYTIITGLAIAGSISAQTFFEGVAYKGAFAPSPAAAWTDTWTNWDPQNTVYPATTITVNSDITTNTTWTTGTIVFLQNKVYVTSGATLTIQPGVIIRGDKTTESTLIITRGSKINAQGTAANPIVFTSGFAAGSRGLGDWGGIILLGAAKTNNTGGVQIVEGGLDPVKAEFGGTNDNDSSGVFKYVRIEFAGFPFQPDKEINGLTMGAVGRKTMIDYVQCSFTNDDSFEWFGGTVNCKHLIAYRGLDDDFDTDNGYRGNLQFLLAVRDPQIADQSSSSTSEGFESDNDATGSNAVPYTAPIFSNVTLIGPYRGAQTNTVDAKFRRGLRLRRNTYTSVFNSIVMDWKTGLHFDGSASEQNLVTDSMKFKSNWIAGFGTATALQSATPATVRAKIFPGNDTVVAASSVGLTTPYNFAAPDYRPGSTSPAISGASFTDAFFTGLVNTGIDAVSKNIVSTFKLYPNPASKSISLLFNALTESQIVYTITDMSGKIVAKNALNPYIGINNSEIDLVNFDNGLYTITLNGKTANQIVKFVVSK
jgi:Secretion system C-terminal sorting domain